MTGRSPTASPWWARDVHADRRPGLLARNRIKAAIRAWFEAEGFVEVDTGILQVSPGNETHLHAFKTELAGTDLVTAPLYLHTSPEFACKKLLAAGEKKIFTFAPVFRNRERGALHAPEFTMLEWYRVGAPYATLWDDCAAILQRAADVTGRAL
jgi:elongation factor P--(R)-beta-lysine ligase